jgi:hypothetical protein
MANLVRHPRADERAMSSIKLAAALQRLVTEGGIEKRLQGNVIPRTRGGMVLAIGLYRRLAVKEAAN